MGIVERELAAFDLADGRKIRIELNRNDRVHLHVDGIRLDLSVEEFEQFVEVVSTAKGRLEEVKELDR